MKNSFFFFAFIFSCAVTAAAQNAPSRYLVIEETLDKLEQEKQVVARSRGYDSGYAVYASSRSAALKMEKNAPGSKTAPGTALEERSKGYLWPIAKDINLIFGAQIGYMKGTTAYDFDYHTSELTFPMENWMGGGNLSLGYKGLSLNAEVWSQLENDAGKDMKDKDWNSNGQLVSYTRSRAELEAVIWDANLQYDFLNIPISKKIGELALTGEEVFKLGALAGYRYENFGYDMFGVEYPDFAITLYPETKSLGYKIKYKLPYAGLAAEVANKKFGLDLNLKYSYDPRAKDIDYHFLRELTFYGDYDRNRRVFFGRVGGFWKMTDNFKLRFGADGTYAKIDGTTWDETHNPAWDAVQDTVLEQWIFWSGIDYKF